MRRRSHLQFRHEQSWQMLSGGARAIEDFVGEFETCHPLGQFVATQHRKMLGLGTVA